MRDGDRLGAGALAVLGLVGVFFFGLMATVANPFEVVGPVPADGPGPNALLQNHLLMAVHPPLLYLGYVGLTVPFAFAVSALLLGHGGTAWLARTRRWSLAAWTFLTAGIVVGGWWSYEVLGWGGFWAWDPVENASLLPWLVATAFIHSAAVQLARGTLQPDNAEALWLLGNVQLHGLDDPEAATATLQRLRELPGLPAADREQVEDALRQAQAAASEGRGL